MNPLSKQTQEMRYGLQLNPNDIGNYLHGNHGNAGLLTRHGIYSNDIDGHFNSAVDPLLKPLGNNLLPQTKYLSSKYSLDSPQIELGLIKRANYLMDDKPHAKGTDVRTYEVDQAGSDTDLRQLARGHGLINEGLKKSGLGTSLATHVDNENLSHLIKVSSVISTPLLEPTDEKLSIESADKIVDEQTLHGKLENEINYTDEQNDDKARSEDVLVVTDRADTSQMKDEQIDQSTGSMEDMKDITEATLLNRLEGECNSTTVTSNTFFISWITNISSIF